MVHPIQRMVERINGDGACPRIRVNLTCEGVVCPDFVVEQWKEELIIDLDPSYPLNLVIEGGSIEADLSFGGYVTRCIFPYRSIYVVADRATGKGIVLDENMPDSVRRKRQAAAVLRNIQTKSRRTPGESRRRRRPKKRAQASKPEIVEAPLGVEDTASKTTPSPAQDEAVRRRRSGFRVIDGGT